MKKIVLLIFALIVLKVNAVEILNEFYVMQKVIPFIEKGDIYDLNGVKVKATKVDYKILKALSTSDDPFYFYDSNRQQTSARIGDYLISPLSLSEIYSVDMNVFKENYIKD
ncbi:hypothetical protein [Fusobacterium russii]|uniref:hypothetical protein n=1 Tax=Fusobacterium russii TaxID=854 RepID=UPI0003A8D503|nr:hypothetical protein [Fusobacterium russii]